MLGEFRIKFLVSFVLPRREILQSVGRPLIFLAFSDRASLASGSPMRAHLPHLFVGFWMQFSRYRLNRRFLDTWCSSVWIWRELSANDAKTCWFSENLKPQGIINKHLLIPWFNQTELTWLDETVKKFSLFLRTKARVDEPSCYDPLTDTWNTQITDWTETITWNWSDSNSFSNSLWIKLSRKLCGLPRHYHLFGGEGDRANRSQLSCSLSRVQYPTVPSVSYFQSWNTSIIYPPFSFSAVYPYYTYLYLLYPDSNLSVCHKQTIHIAGG